MKKLYIIGIDEAGRGSWAWPVVAGGWMADAAIATAILSSIDWLTDSKLLTAQKRERIFSEIEKLQYRDECQYAFAYRDASFIDQYGIRTANRQCMQDIIISFLQFIDPDDFVEIYIDGCDNYEFDLSEESIGYDFMKMSPKKIINTMMTGTERIKVYYRIQGDKNFFQISAASIVAKVIRDRMMCDFHEDFPLYWFDRHKGYGTSKHNDAMINYGITPIHRKSYEPVKSLILDRSCV